MLTDLRVELFLETSEASLALNQVRLSTHDGQRAAHHESYGDDDCASTSPARASAPLL